MYIYYVLVLICTEIDLLGPLMGLLHFIGPLPMSCLGVVSDGPIPCVGPIFNMLYEC